MAATKFVRACLATATLACAPALFAQQPPPAGAKPAAPAAPVPEPRLVFDREVFSYSGITRRDPFKPLVGKESLGPLFDDLKLRGIIYSTDPNRSLVLIQDGAKRMYRLHRGDVVGNSRVVEIRPLAVRFAVENFGMIRNQVLELRPGAADAAGLSTQQPVPVPATQPTAGGIDFSNMDKATAKRMLDSLAKARREEAAKKKTNNDDWPFQPEARR